MIYAILVGVVLGYALLTGYALQALKVLRTTKAIRYLFVLLSAGIILNVFWQWTQRDERVWTSVQLYSMGALLTWALTLATLSLVLFIEDIQRFINLLVKRKQRKTEVTSRRKFVSLLGLGMAAIPFASMIYGMTKGKYHFKVWKHTLYFDDLPEAFNGFKITQISDIHSGSFDNEDKIRYAIDLINEQKSNIITFTGDMVNNLASEMLPWKDIFKNLHAPEGLFAVLGNHDYGDYSSWESPKAKAQNLQLLKDIQAEIGFDLLLNEHRYIEKAGQRIALIGVENWGYGRFSKYGDLEKALKNTHEKDFKILLSHDPTHWQFQVIPQQKNIHLTLSGHTHGMQFGIEIPGWLRWSPSQWKYKYWAGIYEQNGKFLNVNRGFGFLAFPGRVGIWPEITVIELKGKKQKNETTT
ncbi:metallophosphoesterase [Capnocytophaga canimorsus]|uniref:metallophosphoesterase n=1 Tax=Capnocytophaga canimorsus TaxID=28188 RepID=UPI0037D21D8A